MAQCPGWGCPPWGGFREQVIGFDLDDYSISSLHSFDIRWPSFLAFEQAPTCCFSSSGSAAIPPSFATSPSGRNPSAAPQIPNRFPLGYPRSIPPFRGFRTRPRSGQSDHPASRNHTFLPPFLLPHHSSTPYPHISMVFGPFWTIPVPLGSSFKALSIHTISTQQRGYL